MDLNLPAGEALAGFALAATLMEITPGPNMGYLAIVALTDGRRAGYAAVAGVALGLALVGLAAALGLGAVVTASPALYQALRWGGVGYLLWLAWQGWRGADEAPEHAAHGASLGRFLARGLVTNLLNPKAFAFFLTMMPGFIDMGAPVAPQAVALSLIYVAIATAVHLLIVTAADASGRLLASDRRQQAIRRVLALMLVGVAIWLAIKTAA